MLERIAQLKHLVQGFLVTFVEREGRMGGTDLERAKAVVEAARPARVTIAGGVTTPEEIKALDEIGADAQVGMALYAGRLDLGDAIMAPLVTDRPDGLFPTVVVDERGVALGLVYSSRDSIREAVRRRVGVYQSRSRGLWVKGETSGATQELLRIDLDCDRDSPRFVVRQRPPGFCHKDTRTCWGEDEGLGRLGDLLRARREGAPAGSYTARLFADRDSSRCQAARGGRRADASPRPATRSSGKPPTSSISPSSASRARASTWPRSSAISTAVPSR